MRASDTILAKEFLRSKLGNTIEVGSNATASLSLQAEISFKAGYDEAMLEAGRANGLALMEGKQAGIKEVVEWIYTHYSKDIVLSDMLGLDCWNEKLKEWGIE